MLASLAFVGVFPRPSTPLRWRPVAPQSRTHAKMMFSGIVEEMGTVESLEADSSIPLWDGTQGEGWRLRVACETVVQDATEGCSISVNGVCLTVVRFDGAGFEVGLAPETMRRSNVAPGRLAKGDRVNLERALAADGRNSGHMVQGHVDGVGEIVRRTVEGDSLWVEVKAPAAIMRNIVPKGFIAVDGTSLTVCDVHRGSEEGTFTFMLVAYTQQHVIIPSKAVGDLVNLEVDVLGKYVQGAVEGLEARVEALELRLAELEKKGA